MLQRQIEEIVRNCLKMNQENRDFMSRLSGELAKEIPQPSSQTRPKLKLISCTPAPPSLDGAPENTHCG
jgi:hypothetical protein